MTLCSDCGRPTALDLYCGAGGSGAGWDRAGFCVTGVDVEPHADYPFRFIQADATTYPLDGFTLLTGSPPCHDHSKLRTRHPSQKLDHGTAWMLEHTLERFRESGRPYVIENVDDADLAGLLRVTLCGSQFGLGALCRDGVYRQLRRHRQFVSNLLLMAPGPCRHRGLAVGVYGHGGASSDPARGYQAVKSEGAEAMGIGWMRQEDLAQAIPPAYTEFLGEQVLAQIVAAP